MYSSGVTLLLPLLHVLGHCHAGRPIHDPFSVVRLMEGGFSPQDFMVHGSIHRYMVPYKETVPKHDVSTSVLGSGNDVLGVRVSISLPPNESSRCQRAQFWSHLSTSRSPKLSLSCSGVHWQTSDGSVHVPTITGTGVSGALNLP